MGGLWMVVYRPKWYLRDRNGMGGLLVQAQVRYLPRSPMWRAEACEVAIYLNASKSVLQKLYFGKKVQSKKRKKSRL